MGHSAFGSADEYQTYAGCGFDKVGEHDKYTGRELCERVIRKIIGPHVPA